MRQPPALIASALMIGLLAGVQSATAATAAAAPTGAIPTASTASTAAAGSMTAFTATTATTTTATSDWGTAPSHSDVDRNRKARIIDLRYAEHRRFDRVVIDVKGKPPGYNIGYTKRLFYDGSGQPVGLKGKKRMLLVLRSSKAHQGTQSIYQGPRHQQVNLPTLRGIAMTGDFEGEVSFGFSTSRKAPYRIFTLTNPSRVVLDWKH